jgi:hypothetical protein
MNSSTPKNPPTTPYPSDDSVRRSVFKDREELVGHVARVFGIEPISPGVLRAGSTELRAGAPKIDLSDRRVRFDDPVLDLITSPDGTLEVGGVQYDLRDGFLSDRRGEREGAVFALTCMQDFPSGFERCESDDGSKIVFRSGPSSITFRAFKSSFLGYWKMGAEITTDGPDFEAAQIDSRYYFPTVGQVCTAISDSDSDTNDNHVDEYESGLFSEQPVRVVSLCRVQWNGRRIAGIVSKGQECFAIGVEPFPSGFPEDWPPLDQPDPVGAITINPRTLSLISRPERPTGTKSLRITNTHAVPKVVTVGEAEVGDQGGGGPIVSVNGTFSNPSGDFTIPGNGGSVQIAVSFTGQSGFGSIEARIPISWDGQLVNVSVTGTILQVIAQ